MFTQGLKGSREDKNDMKQEETKSKGREFYQEAVRILNRSGIPYLIGGGFALKHHTGVHRDTKDLDIFCKAGSAPKILKALAAENYNTEITDSRWISKAYKDNHFIDIIFNTVNNLCPVDDSWFDHAVEGIFLEEQVRYIAPEELFWCKIYVQNREHYDAADLNHLILKNSHEMDWNRVMMRMEQHWHLLLAQFLNFQFVYPADRDKIPKWLFDELLDRAKEQYDFPAPMEKVCRGPLVDHSMYTNDIIDWGYKIITVKNL
ncbi:MAG TPA: nucleotidyltransferase [Cytophagaceae bacterium]